MPSKSKSKKLQSSRNNGNNHSNGEPEILEEQDSKLGHQQMSSKEPSQEPNQPSQQNQSKSKNETIRTASSFRPVIEQGHDAVEPDDSPAPEPERGQEDDKDSDITVETLLRMVLGVVSGLAVNYTKMPELEFSENEKEVLVEAWKPFMADTIPPVWAAVMVTATIVGGKVVIYMNKRKGVA